MKNIIPQTLSEIMGKNLSGFQLIKAYYLELRHDSMGTFPALIVDNKNSGNGERIVVCAEESLLFKVLELLPPRKWKKTEIILLANVEKQYGFVIDDIDDYEKEKIKPLHILNQSEFNQLVAENEKPFKWAPGGISNDMSEKEFIETVETALKKIA